MEAARETAVRRRGQNDSRQCRDHQNDRLGCSGRTQIVLEINRAACVCIWLVVHGAVYDR